MQHHGWYLACRTIILKLDWTNIVLKINKDLACDHPTVLLNLNFAAENVYVADVISIGSPY